MFKKQSTLSPHNLVIFFLILHPWGVQIVINKMKVFGL